MKGDYEEVCRQTCREGLQTLSTWSESLSFTETTRKDGLEVEERHLYRDRTIWTTCEIAESKQSKIFQTHLSCENLLSTSSLGLTHESNIKSLSVKFCMGVLSECANILTFMRCFNYC